MINVGITGTRFGMTPKQASKLRTILEDLNERLVIAYLCHGDCIGVDAQAHDMAVQLGIMTHVFPPDVGETTKDIRAGKQGNVMNEPLTFLARDREIVFNSHILIGIPQKDHETTRSGTWYTIRFGLKQGDKIVSGIMPDGTICDDTKLTSKLLVGKWGKTGNWKTGKNTGQYI
jgi:hypothetical protein